MQGLCRGRRASVEGSRRRIWFCTAGRRLRAMSLLPLLLGLVVLVGEAFHETDRVLRFLGPLPVE